MRDNRLFQVVHAICFLLFFLVCCKDESVNRPVFETDAVTEIGSEGVVLNGKIAIIGANAVEDYGFVFGVTSNPDVSNFAFYFHTRPAPGPFSANISENINPSTAYFVRAFLKSSQGITYGNQIRFQSLAPVPAVITDFEPKTGTSLTTITITGENFNEVPDNNTVNLGPVTCKVLSATRNQLIVQIPSITIEGKFQISVGVYNNTTTTTDYFTLSGPTISSFSPTLGVAGTTVTIAGTGFSTTLAEDSVRFGNVVSVIKSASAEQLTVIVPQVPLAGPVNITLAVKKISVTSSTQFNIEGPTISSFSPAAGVKGTLVTITGTNFSTNISDNIVTFSGTPAIVTAATAAQLNVLVPSTSFAGPMTLSVKVYQIVAVASSTFSVDGPEITSFSPQTDYPGRTVTITGTNFSSVLTENQVFFGDDPGTVLTSSPTQLTAQIPFDLSIVVRYSPVEVKVTVGSLSNIAPYGFTPLSPWTQLETFDGVGRSGACGFSIGSYGYVGTGLGNTSDLNDFWQYDPARAWSRMSDFPGASRAYSFCFSLNGKGYIGGGVHFSNGTDLSTAILEKDLWEYDPQSNAWTRKQDFPSLSTDVNNRVTAMAVGTKAYVVDGSDFYDYDPSLDQWTKRAQPFPGMPTPSGISFCLGGKGYTGLGAPENKEFWEYDPQADMWTKLADYPGGSNVGDISFAINGKAYVGTGDFYMFDPSSGTWTQIPDNDAGFVSYAANFVINGRGYFVTGAGSLYYNELYNFTPNF